MESRPHFSAEQMKLPSPWDGILIPVSAFPMAGEELAAVAGFVQKFEGLAGVGRPSLSAETFVQVEQSDDLECRRIYAQSARAWIPEVGLGVWAGRKPPSTWSKEEFMNLTPGKKIRALMHQVLRITASPKARMDAFTAMFPFGAAIRIWTHEDGDAFLNKATSVLLPPIKDPSCTCYPFYFPLFDRHAFESATVEQLDAWVCSASVYIRESFEDQGILIAAREPLAPMMEKLGCQFESAKTPVWRIPQARYR
jgi:hypothetical protein